MSRPKLVTVYDRLEKIYARKGQRSLWPNQRFRHEFKAAGTRVLGVQESGNYFLRAGDLVLRSTKGKRLWKMFSYPVK